MSENTDLLYRQLNAVDAAIGFPDGSGRGRIEMIDAQVREAFMAGYHAHFDKASALAHELGENNLGPKTARIWKFTDNVIAGDMAPEAFAAYLASRQPVSGTAAKEPKP